MRARRFYQDKPDEPLFWLGLAYDKLSAYGLSFVRPLTGWLAVLLVFTGLYWSLGEGECQGRNGMWDAAFALSLSNGFVVGGFGRSEKAVQAQACLYGAAHGYTGRKIPKAELASLPPCTPLAPIIPTCVTILAALQTIFSILCLFLLALAVRNRFRIR